MSRRDNAAYRCTRCRMHLSLCVCALIPRLETRTHLLLIIHRFEARKPTNTGQLAAACLANSTLLVRGHEGLPSAAPAFPGRQPLLLFPHEHAVPLTAAHAGAGPVSLIVPDGTWRQAARVRARVPGLSNVPCVTLPAGAASSYGLRAESHDGGLATIEAIARAFGILEGPEIQLAIEHVFLAMVERTRWARGEISASQVSSGLPEGALRHDPESGLSRAK
jgi:DTW domain-containing protein YfiP